MTFWPLCRYGDFMKQGPSWKADCSSVSQKNGISYKYLKFLTVFTKETHWTYSEPDVIWFKILIVYSILILSSLLPTGLLGVLRFACIFHPCMVSTCPTNPIYLNISRSLKLHHTAWKRPILQIATFFFLMGNMLYWLDPANFVFLFFSGIQCYVRMVRETSEALGVP